MKKTLTALTMITLAALFAAASAIAFKLNSRVKELEAKLPAPKIPVEAKSEELSEQEAEELKASLNAAHEQPAVPQDLPPSVSFAHNARYLAPVGARTIALKSVNTPSVVARVRRIPAENIVQFLALEERAYDHVSRSWCDDDLFARDLADVEETFTLKSVNRKNEVEELYLRLGGGKGVSLVSIATEKNDGKVWLSKHRVVAVTDLVLSVREEANEKDDDKIVVWVTSLSTGKPVEGAAVKVYSSANIPLAEGVSGADGICTLVRSRKGSPFAVIASTAEDTTFIALAGSRSVEEDDRAEAPRLSGGEIEAFVWTERGIYRHGEKIFVQAILRGKAGRAPKPMPLELQLKSPTASVFTRRTVTADDLGVICDESFSVPADQPSGEWEMVLAVPGANGARLGHRFIKVEEFAPPTIRVAAAAVENAAPSNFAFTVSAEHLYGGPAVGLACEGAVAFEDAPFTPQGWNNYFFGAEDRRLKPNFRRLKEKGFLDRDGRYVFSAPLFADAGLPAAALKVTAQATVFEDGGRPAASRTTAVLHHYPFYIGAALPAWFKRPETGRVSIPVACVGTDGRLLAGRRSLKVKLERIDSVYTYKRNANGSTAWTTERVNVPVGDTAELSIGDAGDAIYTLPVDACGDYALSIWDEATGVRFNRRFYLSDWGDDTVRAPLSQPSTVGVKTDREFYRVGEKAKIVVKSPFTGSALLSICHDRILHVEAFALTNATSEIELPAAAPDWAPNVRVNISVVRAVESGKGELALRAHGNTALRVRPLEREIPVELKSEVKIVENGSLVRVALRAPGARRATIAAVDEGIDLLTGGWSVDPILWFSRLRFTGSPLYDLYNSIFPVFGEDSLAAAGVKTGGGADAELFGRVSPVPSRRFKPLAVWRKDLALDENGAIETEIALPEFAGSVRLTAVAVSESASGAARAVVKVTPKLVIEPDAPRFVAPGDEFEVSLPIANRGKDAGEVKYQVTAKDAKGVASVIGEGAATLEPDANRTEFIRCRAPEEPGELEISYVAEGLGERHSRTIAVPVRPAVSWRAESGVAVIAPGKSWCKSGVNGPFEKFSCKVSPDRFAELDAAYRWLAEYPHGCLEQTSSQILPLLGTTNAAVIAAGVARVSSMLRANDFVMWPDCDYAPWDREVSLYAAHFLIEAERSGARVVPAIKSRVLRLCGKWALDETPAIAAYACHDLALAGKPDKDRMLTLYTHRDRLSALDRARLARAYIATADRARAAELLRGAFAPQSVKEAAFEMLALLELDETDGRIPELAEYLAKCRDRGRYSWGTTGENAHALLALGAYFKTLPRGVGSPKVVEENGELVNRGDGVAFVSWNRWTLPKLSAAKSESNGLKLERRYFTAEGERADLENLKRGDLVVVELELGVDESRDLNDLVIEDLLPGAFEPVNGGTIEANKYAWLGEEDFSWVMRSDLRDDRMLVFSKKFRLEKGETVKFHYQVRIVSSGAYALGQAAVEAMYSPCLRARTRGGRVVVRH